MIDPAPFGQVTALQATDDPHRFAADVHPGWTIGGRPNGGYLLALLARGVSMSGAPPHVLAASAHYRRAPGPGPVEIRTGTLRTGRTASATSSATPRTTPAPVGCGRSCSPSRTTSTPLAAGWCPAITRRRYGQPADRAIGVRGSPLLLQRCGSIELNGQE